MLIVTVKDVSETEVALQLIIASVLLNSLIRSLLTLLVSITGGNGFVIFTKKKALLELFWLPLVSVKLIEKLCNPYLPVAFVECTLHSDHFQSVGFVGVCKNPVQKVRLS